MSFPWKSIEFIFICFGIILIILLTIGGNLVVLFAFCNDSHLLTPSNNFLLSMAIADLLVGLICMPFYSYAQMQNSWPFGKLFCNIWITIDDVVTMASVLSIVAITIERYWSINHSVHYRRHTTKTRIRIFSILIWLIPFLNFAPGIWFLELNQDTQLLNQFDINITTKQKFECIGAYHSHTLYLIIAQINFFAWPLVVIIVLNALIVINLYKRSHRFPVFASFRVPQYKQQLQQRTSILREDYHEKTVDKEEEEQQHVQQIDNDVQIMTAVNESNCYLSNKIDSEHNNNLHSEKTSPDNKDIVEIPIDDHTVELEPIPLPSFVEFDSRQSTNIYSRFKHVFIPPTSQLEPLPIEHRSSKSTQTFPRPSVRKKSKQHSIFVWRHHSVLTSPSDLELRSTANTGTGEQRIVRRLRRDKRAATSLFTLVLVFMFFLLPYVVVVVVGRIFSLEVLTDTNGQVYSAAFWLLWLNSTVNPILYPFIQPRFREAYRRLFVRFTRRRRRLVLLINEIHRTK
ncbi:unnamed protein product [Rotaria sordida]|uniref:G-protein coupled receptors family 1 profile domain-containing protein n=1 Tax=Rotaria sordida TaxID=392033 RepID=A0A818U422_9BILA|nr:unnamed protein product [Rotaria sordida]CAF1152702.1 unnamed protein product [Rotaria sordida]CAF1171749.1 unnamed protein product [Rotaria sordida]CAF1199256.1 unnamed protein product [Rotaria sordida]CAF1393497.1 unnamed protein product [Rotaria sordida]